LQQHYQANAVTVHAAGFCEAALANNYTNKSVWKAPP